MTTLRLSAAALLLPWILSAQEAKPAHVVRASATATVTAKPDRAEISIGVITEGPTAMAASSDNAAQTTQLLSVLKQTVGSSGQIKTSGYSISPQYQYPNNGTPKLTGYRASNTVQVVLDDISAVSKVIDNSTKAGANNINGVSFSLKDDSEVRAKALTEAAMKARAEAEAIARALNLKVIGVLQAESTEASYARPMVMMAAMAPRAKMDSTPIESGDLDIRASVVVTLEVQ